MNETLSRTIPQPKTETGEGAAAFSGKLEPYRQPFVAAWPK